MIRNDPDDLGRRIAEPIEHQHLRGLTRPKGPLHDVAPVERRGRGLDLGVCRGGPTGPGARLQADGSGGHCAHGALVGLLLDEHLHRRGRRRAATTSLDLGGELTSELGSNS